MDHLQLQVVCCHPKSQQVEMNCKQSIFFAQRLLQTNLTSILLPTVKNWAIGVKEIVGWKINLWFLQK